MDAFACKENAKLPRFWTKTNDAFSKDWSFEVLWLNPPFSQMETVVQKILLQQAQGILVIPCWKRYLWFTFLESIAVKWLAISSSESLYETVHGRPLLQRPGWRSRAVVFNAFGALKRLNNSLDWHVAADDGGILSLKKLLFKEKDVPVTLSIA